MVIAPLAVLCLASVAIQSGAMKDGQASGSGTSGTTASTSRISIREAISLDEQLSPERDSEQEQEEQNDGCTGVRCMGRLGSLGRKNKKAQVDELDEDTINELAKMTELGHLPASEEQRRLIESKVKSKKVQQKRGSKSKPGDPELEIFVATRSFV